MTTTLSFDDCIQTLESYVYRRGIHYDTDHLIPFLDKLGNPHLACQNIIHVAGTNGKGSTIHFIEAGLIEAGCSVGTFTSPHLHCYTERFKLNNTPISKKRFNALFQSVQSILKDASITEFEILTLMGFLLFKEERPDIILLETGLGGRLDATNLITPILSIITKIDFDHMAILGDTLQKIAHEKAGIIKKNTPILSAVQDTTVTPVLKKEAQSKSAPLKIISPETPPKNIALKGHFQHQNYALAKASFSVLSHHLPIDKEHFLQGLQNAHLAGRYEKHRHQNQDLIIDGAHNQGAIKTLVASIQQDYPNQKLPFMMAILKTKDAKGILEEIAPICSTLYYLNSPSPDYHSSDTISTLTSLPIIPHHTLETLPKEKKSPLIITGSLHFIGDLRFGLGLSPKT